MTVHVTFDEALPRFIAAVESSGVAFAPGTEGTVIRDLAGRLRLHLRAPQGAAGWPPGTRNTLQAEVEAAAAPYAASTLYLDTAGSPDSQFPLHDMLATARRPWSDAPPTGPIRWFVIERRYSKDAWIEATGTNREPWSQAESPCNVISFYGFKGGVGRTTALAAVALDWAMNDGRNVVAVDLDIESPGLGPSLLRDEQTDLGCVDYVIEHRIGSADRIPLGRFLADVDLPGAAGSLRIVPAGKIGPSYLEKLGRVDLHGAIESERAAGAALLHLLKRIRDEHRPDAILLDVRAGLHDLGGITMSGLSHLELIFAAHSEQTWNGLRVVLRHLGRLRADWVRLVHTMVPPESRGGRELHTAFIERAYDVCSAEYYVAGDVPALDDETAAHYPYRVPFREALLGLATLRDARSILLSDEHRLFSRQLASDTGVGP